VITETAGIGGFAMALHGDCEIRGRKREDAIRYTWQMYEITVAENDTYQILRLISGYAHRD